MTTTAEGTITHGYQGDAPDLLREMAAVIRTVFGVAQHASRRAENTTPSEAAAPPAPAAAPTPEPPAPEPPAATAPADIPVPASIPMPDLPAPTRTQPPAAEAEPAEEAYTGPVPALRLVPDPTPTDHVPAEHRHAVLREVAFLDD